jgi:lysophospholipase L1-like esterase
MNNKRNLLLAFAVMLVSAFSVNAAELPNVLLIGDSISIHYTKPTQELLKGKANVLHHPGNAMWSSLLLKKLDSHLAAKKWDVIHFNVGNWDVCDSRGPKDNSVDPEVPAKRGVVRVSEEKYRKNLEEIIKKLKATGAKVIWASTTHIPNKKGVMNKRVPIYNKIAEELMKKNGIPINDLYTYVEPKLKELQRPANCHFKEEGSKFLAEKVAEFIKKNL